MRDVVDRTTPNKREAPSMVGDYRVERLIARGEITEVYEARQISGDRVSRSS